MPGPGTYISTGKGLKRKPGSVKRDSSGTPTAVQTPSGSWITSGSTSTADTYPTPTGYPSSGSGVSGAGASRSQGPTALQALRNVRAKRKNQSEFNKTDAAKDLASRKRSATAGIARLGRQFKPKTVGQFAADNRKVSPDVKRAQKRFERQETNKDVKRTFEQVALPAVTRAENASRVQGKTPSPQKMAKVKYTNRKQMRKLFPDVRSQAELIGEMSRAAWRRSPIRKESPWRGVDHGEETVRLARKLVSKGNDGVSAEQMWPEGVVATRRARRKERRERREWESKSDLEKLGHGLGEVAETTGAASAYRVGRSLSPTTADVPGLKQLDKASGAKPGQLPAWKDVAETAMLAAGSGTGGLIGKGITKAVSRASKEADELAEAGGRTFVAGPIGAKTAPRVVNATTGDMLKAHARASKIGRGVERIQKVRGSKGYKRTTNTARVAGAGAALGAHDKTFPAVQGTAEALWESPWDVGKATGRAAISSLTFPFALGGNAALAFKQGRLTPLTTLASEELAETKRIAGILLSGDAEKVKKLTKEELGLMGALGAYWLARPAWKGPVRAGVRKAGEKSKRVQSAIDFFDTRKKLSRLKTAQGRADADAYVRMTRQTDKIMERRRAMNEWLHGGRGREVQRVLDKHNERVNKARGGDKNNLTRRPIQLEDLAVFAATRGIPEGAFTPEHLTALRRGLDVDAEDHHYINAFTEAINSDAWRNSPRVQKQFNDLVEEIRKVTDEMIDRDEPFDIGPDGQPRRAGELHNARGVEVMAAADAVFKRGSVARPEVRIKEHRQAEQDRLSEMRQDVSRQQRERRTVRGRRRVAEGELKQMEITERARTRKEERDVRRAEAGVQRATGRLENLRKDREADAETLVGIRKRRTEIRRELKAIGNRTWEAGERYGAGTERLARDADRKRWGKRRLRSSNKVLPGRYRGPFDRREANKRQDALLREQRELSKQEAQIRKRERATARAEEQVKHAERALRTARTKQDHRLRPLQHKVALLMNEERDRGLALAEAIENTRSYMHEINNTLTREEHAAAVARARQNLPAETRVALGDVEGLQREVEGARREVAEALREQERAEREGSRKERKEAEKRVERANKRAEVAQENLRKVASEDGGRVRTRKTVEAELKVARNERDNAASERVGATGAAAARAEREYRLAESREAGLRAELDRLRNESAARLDAEAIKAELARAKQKKREDRERPLMEAFQTEFNDKLQEYYDLGWAEAAYVSHKKPKGPGVDSGNPSFSTVLGAPGDRLRTGEMARRGTADRSFDAFIETLQMNNARIKNKNLTNWLVANETVKVADHRGVMRHQHTDAQLENMKIDNPNLMDGKLKLDSRLVADPSRFGSVIDLKQVDQNKIDSLVEDIDAEEARAEGREASGVDRLAQKTAREGQGRTYVLMDEKVLQRVLDNEEKLSKGMSRAFRWVEALPARLVLGTSPSWLFAQPIAEMLVLMLDHPARTFKAIHDHWHMKERDPDAFHALKMVAGNSLGTDLMQTSRGQAMISKGVKGYRRTHQGILIRELGGLQALGKIDRAKSAFIREIGVLAEMDRELSSVRRQSKAVMGQMDDVEKIADRLSRLPTREEQLKYLHSPEGQAAGLRLARNIDASLGNWMDLTKAEKIASRIIFFYPFVRFSINWTFRTFPKRHPARYALLNTLGVANAAMVERHFGEPNWANEWAQVPLFGGENGEVTGSIPLHRYIPGGNALVEAGMGEGNFAFNLTKGLNPLWGIAARLIASRDAFGEPLEGRGYGLKMAGVKEGLAGALDEIMNLPVPLREFNRELSIDFNDRDGKVPFLKNKARELRPGDDPNSLTDYVRRDLIAGWPQAAHQVRLEREVDKAFKDREIAQRLSSSRTKYSALANKGKAVLDRESKWRSAREGDWIPVPGRTPAEKKAVKRYIAEAGQRKFHRREFINANRRIFDLYVDNGFEKTLPAGIRAVVKKNLQDTRKKANPGEFIVWNNRMKWVADHQARVSEYDRLAYEAAKGGKPLDPSMRESDYTGPDWVTGKKIKTQARIPKNALPDDIEAKIANAPTTYSKSQIRRLQALPRPRKVEFAKKILKAKNEYLASKTGVKGNDVSAQMAKALAPMGYNRTAIAGIIGNAYAESTLNPTADDGAGNGGLLGFTAGEKSMASLRAFADANGLDWTKPSTQMKFADTTVSDDLKERMNNAASPEEAATLFMDEWERPGIPREDVRHEGARTAWENTFTEKKGGNKALERKWLAMVARGKAMGVYDTPREPVTIKTHPGEAGTKGDWSGGKLIIDRLTKKIGVADLVSNNKRTPEHNASVGGSSTSDHLTTSTSSYAADISASGDDGERIARELAAELNLDGFQTGNYNRYESPKYPGYSFQILWNVKGHYDHVHIGVNTPNAEGKLTVGPMSPMQQVKQAIRARRAAKAASSGSGSSGGGGTGGGGTGGGGTGGGTMAGAGGGDAYDRYMNAQAMGGGGDMEYPSAVESQVAANSATAGLTNLPEYKKPTVPKARRRKVR